MTQEELAAKLGVAKSTVANWETGKHFPKRKLGAVEQALGISLDEEPEEPEIPKELMRLIEQMPPDMQPDLIETIRQHLAGEPPPAAGTGLSGRRRRAAG